MRTNNEDRYLVANILDDLVLGVVADGVGGHAYGELASQATVDVFDRLRSEGKLAAAEDAGIRGMLLPMCAQRAHVEVARLAQENESRRGASCTLTAVIADASQFTAIQVGDSRLYRYSTAGLEQITEDQTVAAELLRAGRISPEQFQTHPDRNTLSQCIGIEGVGHPLAPAVFEGKWQSGDLLLGVTDGVTDMIDDDRIADCCAGVRDMSTIGEALLDAAVDADGKDNATVFLLMSAQKPS